MRSFGSRIRNFAKLAYSDSVSSNSIVIINETVYVKYFLVMCDIWGRCSFLYTAKLGAVRRLERDFVRRAVRGEHGAKLGAYHTAQGRGGELQSGMQ